MIGLNSRVDRVEYIAESNDCLSEDILDSRLLIASVMCRVLMVGGCFVGLRIAGRFQVSHTVCKRRILDQVYNIKIVGTFLVSFDGDSQAVVAECLTNVFLNILNLSRRNPSFSMETQPGARKHQTLTLT